MSSINGGFSLRSAPLTAGINFFFQFQAFLGQRVERTYAEKKVPLPIKTVI